jgi:hypothetical protein
MIITAAVLSLTVAASPVRGQQQCRRRSWQLVLAGGGAFLGRVLTGSRGRLVTGLASSVLIGVLAVRLLVTAV